MHLLRNFLLVKVFVLCFCNNWIVHPKPAAAETNYGPLKVSSTCAEYNCFEGSHIADNDISCVTDVSEAECANLCCSQDKCQGFDYSKISDGWFGAGRCCTSSISRSNGPFEYNGGTYKSCEKNLVTESNEYNDGCRSDICTDYFNDCCAPFDEPRGCSLPGYTVYKGGTSSSCGIYGSDAVYQCCTSQPSSGITSNGLHSIIFVGMVAFMLI